MQLDARPELGPVRHRRRQLHAALVQLEQALAATAGRPEPWRDLVATALTRLRATLDDHTDQTEAPGGLFDQILTEAPRLEPSVARLRQDHRKLAASTDALLAQCRGAIPDSDEVERLRRDALELLGQAARHRQRGSDLLWEAYEVDLSAAD
ncbi:MAG: hypothetical protein M3N57_12550 [Actinomycetota bacterium]|nr:hypothetical protein [Actinomycetota bacterium]